MLTRRRTTGLILALAILLALGHRPLLRWAARPLVAEDLPSEARFLGLTGDGNSLAGESSWRMAAGRYQQRPARRILLIEPWTPRIVELGAVPSFEALARQMLRKYGVPDQDILLLGGQSRDDWDRARALTSWLQANPDEEIEVVCGRFHTGQMRYVLDRTADPADAARVHLVIADDWPCTEDNWWQSREGVKQFMYGWLNLLYTWRHNEDPSLADRQSVAAYRNRLRQLYGEAP